MEVDGTDSERITGLAWALKRIEAKAKSPLPDAKASIDISGRGVYTHLFLVGSLPYLKILPEAGADVRIVDRFKYTPSSYISGHGSHSGRSEAFRLPYLRFRVYMDPLLWILTQVILTSPSRGLKVALDHGADTSFVNRHEGTPLSGAVFYQEVAIVELLIRRGAAIDLLKKNDESLLHRTARFSDMQVIQVVDGAHLRDDDTEFLNKRGRFLAGQEAEERNPKPERFPERFDELLAGIRAGLRISQSFR